ncbi:uncharacterized protein LAESUDRAFT_306178 [Laetiporus sulphureus 93-53]|uniref:Uncharacterized protein n=1 Tax=Laetiporus sulphureus 93-53 TaxID=1314785 RepID=A0A165D8X5_9APHY|nr:uncharacterized protein LAESUDRAFT_306178 [Laetiporus sulphureus 93-53]KZT04358.1 hypothetical protein LAESUDRAFT_306178 [Laetiporus sulphureus 93-53]
MVTCHSRNLPLDHDDLHPPPIPTTFLPSSKSHRGKGDFSLASHIGTLIAFVAAEFPMALGFFKKPRASNRSKVMQMLPAHQVDHNPSEWARTYMEAVAAKATLNVADKVTVTASQQVLTSGRDKPLPPLPWEMVSKDRFEGKDSSGECENEVNEDWMTGGTLLRAFQSSEQGTPTASAAESTVSFLQEENDSVLEHQWGRGLALDMFKKWPMDASLASQTVSTPICRVIGLELMH